MTDVMSAEKRSALMSRIKGKDTTPELLVRRLLWRSGFRFRLHARQLPGRPDIILPRWHAAVFVHGCFWHFHEDCRYSQLPATRADFWKAKLEGNRARDLRKASALLTAGWRVAVLWECAIRTDVMGTVGHLEDWIRGNSDTTDIREKDGRISASRVG